MTVNILTFVCGIGVGLCAAFILMTLVNARRRRHFGLRHRPKFQIDWDLYHKQQRRNDEPTELDQ